MSKTKKKSAKRESPKVRKGSGNVFADLKLADADERQFKADLAHQIRRLIESAELSQAAAADRLGVDQPKISALLRGQLKGFSTERLMRFITALNRDVVITIRSAQDQKHPSVRVRMQA